MNTSNKIVLSLNTMSTQQIENNGESFWCQHGNEECVGNMIQSCGLYALAGYPLKKSQFIACQMNRDGDRTGQTVSIENTYLLDHFFFVTYSVRKRMALIIHI